MGHVGLGDTMSEGLTEPAHDGTEETRTTHQITVHSGEGPTGEGKSGRAVVRKKRISVLQECDHHEPTTGMTLVERPKSSLSYSTY
jgi:hypothetical protein